jgi:hypothetical protein
LLVKSAPAPLPSSAEAAAALPAAVELVC